MTKTLPKVTKAFEKAVEKVLKKHRANAHFMNRGTGVSCFVWVSGKCFSENSLNLDTVEAELAALPGAFNVHINID